MKRQDVAAFARAQRLTRDVVRETAESLRPGDREWDVALRIEEGLTRGGVRHWLHTPYAWWGERTRFAGFAHWQPDALPTDRALQEGEAFILDAAPILDGYPADFAFSGVIGGRADTAGVHERLRGALAELKEAIAAWVRAPCDGASLFERVGEDIARRGLEAIHPLYPARVLGHSLNEYPTLLGRSPRIGDGFQLPLVATAGLALLKHRFARGPYPFVNDYVARNGGLQGIFAVEPHVAEGDVGVKFESILLVDGDESRWLDRGLFGEVEG
jgi:Xaa-Pro aminopeptidase